MRPAATRRSAALCLGAGGAQHHPVAELVADQRCFARVGSTGHESLQDLGLLGARAGREAARPQGQPPRCGRIY